MKNKEISQRLDRIEDRMRQVGSRISEVAVNNDYLAQTIPMITKIHDSLIMTGAAFREAAHQASSDFQDRFRATFDVLMVKMDETLRRLDRIEKWVKVKVFVEKFEGGQPT